MEPAVAQDFIALARLSLRVSRRHTTRAAVLKLPNIYPIFFRPVYLLLQGVGTQAFSLGNPGSHGSNRAAEILFITAHHHVITHLLGRPLRLNHARIVNGLGNAARGSSARRRGSNGRRNSSNPLGRGAGACGQGGRYARDEQIFMIHVDALSSLYFVARKSSLLPITVARFATQYVQGVARASDGHQDQGALSCYPCLKVLPMCPEWTLRPGGITRRYAPRPSGRP
jgi:hypothetical protein